MDNDNIFAFLQIIHKSDMVTCERNRSTHLAPRPSPPSAYMCRRTTRGIILPVLQALLVYADVALLTLSFAENVDRCTRGKVVARESDSDDIAEEAEIAVTALRGHMS
ncbi:hypothetical protein D9619_008663 [Psilocybe cf. subviscida]|uniref:Uncharacterized protein n=1 Tax=Psilocybe cf. subviscida TaxID=2480587 RepID=A0A8H5BAL0_9AGAR|nr:hypothetical protein D9619_008663 [Psilocybe cf. subviscida]